MIGYDTIHMFIDSYTLDKANISRLSQRLERGGYNKNTGEAWSVGNIENLRISVGGAGVSIKGSLSGFYYPNNTILVNRGEVKKAIEAVSDTLHVSLNTAKVTRLDIAADFIMQNEPKAYFDILGTLVYFQRLRATQHTLYYTRGKENLQSLCFYDKTQESKDNKKEMPSVCNECVNVLRYEARFNARLAKQMQRQEVLASTLSNTDFYNEMLEKWGQMYFNINKFYGVGNMGKVKNVTEAKDYIFAVALHNMGAGDVDKILSEMKARQLFNDRKYYSRLKQSLDSVREKYLTSSADDTANELDDEVRNVLAYK